MAEPSAVRPASRPSGWQRLGVRGRLTLVTTAVLALALVAAALLLLVAVRSALLGSLDEAARQRADEIAALVEAGRLPDPLPVTGAAVVQVLDGDDRVLASSPGGDRLAPLLDPAAVDAVRAGEGVAVAGSRVGSPEPFRVVGRSVGVGDAEETVVVATSLAEVERVVGVLRTGLLVGGPLLLAGMALLTWRVSGSALRPVEELRRTAAAVSATARSTGAPALPVPPSDDEVARLAVTLNDMLARLDAASARQRAFVADAAHELRSPLGSVRTQLEVAIAHPDGQDWEAVADGSLADVARMTALVDDLLVLARLDEGVGATRPVDVRELLEGLQGPRRVPVSVETTGALVVPGDPRALDRAFRNLVDNAARHASAGVVVGARRDGDEVVVDVADDGPGIGEPDRERVFERFTRLDEARHRDDGGTGLGLAIARAAVARHGGSLVARGRDDGRSGAVLHVRLPAAPAPPPYAAATPLSRPRPAGRR